MRGTGGWTKIVVTGKPQRQAELCQGRKTVAQPEQIHTTRSKTVLMSTACRKPLSGGHDGCSTGEAFFNSRTELGTGVHTQERQWRETAVFMAIYHHSLKKHCIGGTIPSSLCHSSSKIPSRRALNTREIGSTLTSALGSGSPTVPASRTPPAH